jgi:hypothetical protein
MFDQRATVVDQALHDAEVVIREPVWLCGLRSSVELKALRDYPYRILPVVGKALLRFGVDPVGPPVSVFRSCGDGRFDITAAYPTMERLILGRPFLPIRLPGGLAVQAIHLGPWRTLLSAHDRLSEWLTAHRVPVPPMMWEEYLVGPDLTDDPPAWRTRVVVPLPGWGRETT